MPDQMTVLIVDDDVKVVRLLRVAFEAEGFVVHSAERGTDDIRRLGRIRPDLVVLDISMPEMDGFETLTRLRADESCSSIPVLMLTVRDDEQDRLWCLSHGADDYIVKPFDIDDVLARSHTALRHAVPGDVQVRVLRYPNLVIDLAHQRVSVANQEVHLVQTEWAILNLLTEHLGCALTSRDLLVQVWGRNSPTRICISRSGSIGYVESWIGTTTTLLSAPPPQARVMC